MGVLDDAIREHLELKRQHGAPAQEVAQQEQDALGAPAGRSSEAPVEPEPAVDPEAVADAEPAADEVLAPVEEQLAEEAEPADAPPPADEPLHDPIDEAFAEPVRGDTPPRGFERVEDEPAPPADGEHDVLEDTPEFLEETPEHDRLWFEQKPPRDFDFDE